MAFCSNCQNPIGNSSKFCKICGTKNPAYSVADQRNQPDVVISYNHTQPGDNDTQIWDDDPQPPSFTDKSSHVRSPPSDLSVPQKIPRPRGVTVLGILYIVGGVFSLIVAGLMSSQASSANFLPELSGYYKNIAGWQIIVMILNFVTGGTLFSGKNKGRITAIIAVIMIVLVNIIFLVTAGSAIPISPVISILYIIINGIIIAYLFKLNVKAYFKQ